MAEEEKLGGMGAKARAHRAHRDEGAVKTAYGLSTDQCNGYSYCFQTYTWSQLQCFQVRTHKARLGFTGGVATHLKHQYRLVESRIHCKK